MKTRILFPIILLLISLCFIGCSDLSRGKAKDLILERMNNAAPENYKKDERNLTITLKVDPSCGLLRKDEDEPHYLEAVDMLAKRGYITNNNNNITLHDIIRPYIKTRKSLLQYIDIKIGELDEINITGISGSDTYKTVNYIKIYSLNNLGKEISYSGTLSITGRTIFEKYDDGWRAVGL